MSFISLRLKFQGIEDSNKYHGLFSHVWNCESENKLQKIELGRRNPEEQEQSLGSKRDR